MKLGEGTSSCPRMPYSIRSPAYDRVVPSRSMRYSSSSSGLSMQRGICTSLLVPRDFKKLRIQLHPSVKKQPGFGTPRAHEEKQPGMGHQDP